MKVHHSSAHALQVQWSPASPAKHFWVGSNVKDGLKPKRAVARQHRQYCPMWIFNGPQAWPFQGSLHQCYSCQDANHRVTPQLTLVLLRFPQARMALNECPSIKDKANAERPGFNSCPIKLNELHRTVAWPRWTNDLTQYKGSFICSEYELLWKVLLKVYVVFIY